MFSHRKLDLNVLKYNLESITNENSSFLDFEISQTFPSVSEEANSYITNIAAAAERMQNIIKELQNYFKIGYVEKTFKPTALTEIFKNILNGFEIAVAERRDRNKREPTTPNSNFNSVLPDCLEISKPSR